MTGASGGLGREIALALARNSWQVAIVARSQARLERLAADRGPRLHPFPADVTSPDQVEGLRREVTEALGPVTVLVNAAGIFGPIATIENGDPEEWIATLQTNTIGPYLVCRAFVGQMVAAGWGRILNVTSAASLHPPGALNSAYEPARSR